MEKVKILRIGLTLDRTGYTATRREYNADEKGKSYVWLGTRLAKDKILKVDTQFHNFGATKGFHVFCLEGQQEQAIEILKTEIRKAVDKLKDELGQVISHIDDPITVKFINN